MINFSWLFEKSPQKSLVKDFLFPLLNSFQSTPVYQLYLDPILEKLITSQVFLVLEFYFDFFWYLIEPFISELLKELETWSIVKFIYDYGNELKDLLILIFVSYYILKLCSVVYFRGLFNSFKDLILDPLKNYFFDVVKVMPGISHKIRSELQKVINDIEHKLVPVEHRKYDYEYQLPEIGYSEFEMKKKLRTMKDLDRSTHSKWEEGHVSGTVYHGQKDVLSLLNEAYSLFSVTNPLHPDVFPSIRKMEAEIVQMCLSMYNAPIDSGCGSVTSGGTESILMSVKAHRDWARDVKKITQPEIIVPVTAHAAFDKAAHYFGIRIVHAPLCPKTMGVDINAVRRLINYNTILLVGSAPNYPHGIIDNVEQLSKLALRWKIGLHVDCCLGSFIVPFLNHITDKQVPLFDFRVKGVTAISCDTHKFGFAPKGSSVVMYSRPDIRKYQYFVAPDWLGGIYASPSIAGSRPGGLIAACWTALLKFGKDGYVTSAKKIVSTAMAIKEGIKSIDGIEVVGDPIAMVVAFQSSSPSINIFAVSDKMTEKGWNLNSLQYPPAVHICCTYLTVDKDKEFLKDLAECVEAVKKNPSGKQGMAAIYGMAASIPDRRLVSDIAAGYLDALTKTF